MTLEQLQPSERARVDTVEGADPLMLRLREMGLIPGAPIELKMVAPFGGPMQILVGGYLLSIRRSEARKLKITREEAL